MASSPLHPDHPPTSRLVGNSAALASLRAQITHLARFDAPGSAHAPTVLLQGETGTGKGLVARVLHDSGPRAVGPFVQVNCAAIPETMLEAELFGFEAGAFTDAKRAKPGLFEAASGGSLFLDEIDALPVALQGKLLTAIETKQVRRLGAVAERAVDVKLLTATNADLGTRVAAGQFRADLYHRLAIVVLTIPPLRARGEDILDLAQTFLQHYVQAYGVPPKRLRADAAAWLQQYAWPGNVRELSHVMERVVLLHAAEEVDATVLAQWGLPLTMAGSGAAPVAPVAGTERGLSSEVEQIRQALVQTNGKVARAARLLGISRDALRWRMRRAGIERSDAVSPRARTAAARDDTWTAPPDTRRTPADLPPEAPRSAWEQKPVVVLALELTWPQEATGAAGPYEPWTEAVRWEQAIIDKVQGFGGVLLPRTPALLTWVFGVPQALEQLPQRAVHAALAVRQMVTEASGGALAGGPTLRLAAHLGAVQVPTQATDPLARLVGVGATLAVPVRLLGQAEPGEIVVSPEVGRLVEGGVTLEPRALPGPTRGPARGGGYAVVGVSPGRGVVQGRWDPVRRPLVGRERELAILDTVWQQVQEGRGQALGLVGAPGIGKSRLLAAVRQRLALPGVTYLQSHCLAYGSATPYLPVLDWLRAYGGIAPGESLDTGLSKLDRLLQRAGIPPETGRPALLPLLGVPVESAGLAERQAPVRKAQAFEMLLRLFIHDRQQWPLILAVEDLHWSDPTSEAFLALLIEHLAGVPLLLLATYRPGYRPPWLDKSYATQLALQPLGDTASRQVIQRVASQPALAATLEQQILTKAEGNPFFLEELTYALMEHGHEMPLLAVPDTIQAVLAARMDRLPQVDKTLLQMAAVIGPRVPLALLAPLASLSDHALQHSLAQLQAAELLYETHARPEPIYTFKHVLTQEVAYSSLASEARRTLHARVTDVLTDLVPALTPECMPHHRELLVQHAWQGERWETAARACQEAGAQALAQSAYREAVGYCEQALSALGHLPDQRETTEQAIDLRFALRSALFPFGNLGRILPYLREAVSLAEALNDPRRLGRAEVFLSYHFCLMGMYDQAIASAQRVLARDTAGGDVVLHALVHLYLGRTYEALGDYRQSIDCLRETMAFFDGARRRERFGLHTPPAVVGCAWLARCHAELGTFAEGRALEDEGLRIAEAVDDAGSLMYASFGVGLLALRQGDLPHALPCLEQAMAICQRADFPALFPLFASALGAAYTLAGRVTDAVPLLTQALEQSAATERVIHETPCRLRLGEAQLQAGHLEEASALAEGALAGARQRQERGHQAYALRLLGDIAVQREPPNCEAAETCYCQALALAEALEMRPLQAHCHRGLGTLYATTGQQEQARTALATAIAMYQSMDMTFWLPETETTLVILDK
jgi:DNA-binding NtrC family response regulator/tetratricopeptide (TPR) repeat protein